MNTNQPQGPNYPITNDDKVIIRELGRKLHKFVLDEAKARYAEGRGFHIKYLLGALEYVQRVMGEKANLVAEDILLTQDTVERFNLHDLIEEPFPATPMPTREELKAEAQKKKEEAEKDLALLDATDPEKEAVAEEKKETPNDTASPSSQTKEPIPSPFSAKDLGDTSATA